MESFIVELQDGLKSQLSSLTEQIRTSETSLMALKEGFLKVQGALEILDILSKKHDEMLVKALSDLGAD